MARPSWGLGARAALALAAFAWAPAAAAPAAAAARPLTVVAVVDLAPGVGAEDPGARLRTAWVRFLADATAGAGRFGVATFAGPAGLGWLVPPTRNPSAALSLARASPRHPGRGAANGAAAALWLLHTVGAKAASSLRVVLVADDEPDPNERRVPSAYVLAMGRVAAAYAAAGARLVTVRIGDNPGPAAWPVLPGVPMVRQAPRILAWLGWTPVPAGLVGALPLPATPGLLTLRAGGAIVATQEGAWPGRGRTTWQRASGPSVVAWQRTPGELRIGNYGSTTVAVAVGPQGRGETVQVPADSVISLAAASDSRLRTTGASLVASPGGGQRVRQGFAALTAPDMTQAARWAALGALLTLGLLAMVLGWAYNRRHRPQRLLEVAAGGLRAEAAEGTVSRFPLARRGLVLGAHDGAGVSLAVPTRQAGPLVRLDRTRSGWRATTLGRHHLYVADGVPRREVDLREGEWLMFADVRIRTVWASGRMLRHARRARHGSTVDAVDTDGGATV